MENEATEAPQNDIRAQRLENLQRLKDAGYPPFGAAFERTGRLAEIRAAFEVDKEVKAAGRIVAVREMGKSIFAHIQDGSDRFQIYIKKNVVGEEAFAAFRILDLGDQIGVDGKLFMTRTEEPTINIASWTLLSKSLLPLPDKWDGLQDVESRYRQRYLDLIANPEVRTVFHQRFQIIQEIRSFLNTQEYLEVETPMMQPMAGGATATPFETHYNALGMDVFVRIAPELYLKRLLVGGFDKVFELNRNFRNEGLSRSHNPEFTMLEIYEAFGDRESMQTLVQDMITHLAQTVMGTLQVGTESEPVDLSDWRSVPYDELIAEFAGADYDGLDLAAKRARATELGCDLAQGYLFSPPVPAAEFEAMLREAS